MKTLKINTEFKKLSASEKRIKIIKDSLAQLFAGILCPTEGDYLDAEYKGSPSLDELYRNAWSADEINIFTRKANEFLHTTTPISCHACALGSLFLGLSSSNVKLNYNYSQISMSFGGDEILVDASRIDIERQLGKYFPYWNLDQIENAFEKGELQTAKQFYLNNARNRKLKGRYAYEASAEYQDRNLEFIHFISNRLRLDFTSSVFVHIAANIISNNGYFDPYFTGNLTKAAIDLKRELSPKKSKKKRK